MASIGSLTADLRLESAAFIRDLGKASAAVARNTSQMQRSFAQVQQSVSALDRNITAWLTIRFAKQVARFTNDALKLAASIDGPLRQSAVRLIQSGEEMEQAFKLGFATGVIDAFQGELDSTKEQLREVGEVGRFAGGLVGEAFSAVATIIRTTRKEIEGITAAFKAIDSNIRSFDGTAPGSTAVPLTDVGSIGQALQDFGPTMTVTATEVDTLTDALNKQNTAAASLAGGLAAAGDAASSMGSMHQMTASQVTMGWLGVAETVAGALGTLFGDNKAVAIAMAVINTAQAITAALAQYPPPLSFAMAAAQAAAGAAQIAVIASTNPGSGKKSTAVTKGGGASSAPKQAGAASTASSAGGPSQSVTLVIKGDVFGPEHFRKIVRGINGVTQDGTVLFRTA